jgi:hypothetical protein
VIYGFSCWGVFVAPNLAVSAALSIDCRWVRRRVTELLALLERWSCGCGELQGTGLS